MLANSAGPGGYFRFNTTLYADGLHTISWTVIDKAGRSAGIGSRFFSVANGTASALRYVRRGPDLDLEALPVSDATVRVARDLSGSAFAEARPDADGVRHVVVEMLSIVGLAIDKGSGTLEAYDVSSGSPGPLPIGSTFDAERGTFSWQLGPAFVGVYDLVFVRTTPGGRERIPVRVTVQPAHVK